MRVYTKKVNIIFSGTVTVIAKDNERAEHMIERNFSAILEKASDWGNRDGMNNDEEFRDWNIDMHSDKTIVL